MANIITAVICGALALAALVISILSFCEKGFLFNNAYLWASEKERAAMDKKPHYRQSAIVFAILAAIFLCLAAEALLQTTWLWMVQCGLIVVAIVYAIRSSIR